MGKLVEKELGDGDPMPFGKHAGVRMDQVPDVYVINNQKETEMNDKEMKQDCSTGSSDIRSASLPLRTGGRGREI